MRALTITFALAAAAASVVGIEPSAYATTSTNQHGFVQTYEQVVRFGDLDLGSQHGADQLYSRLLNAARYVCGDTSDPVYFYERHAVRHCEQVSIENAVAEIGRPKVTAVYDEHFPHQPLTSSGRASAVLTDAVTIVAG
jgi:UrcA family protein